MIEAVGEKNLNKYFKTIKNNLKPNGVGAIQAIIIKDDFLIDIKKPRFYTKIYFSRRFFTILTIDKRLFKENRISISGYNSYGIHYSKTLSKWRKNFINSWGKISQQGFDNSFKNLGFLFFSYCEAGFRAKNIDLIQFSFRNE